MLTKVGERASPKTEVEGVAVRAVCSLGLSLLALEVVLGAVVDWVAELEVAVQGAVGAGHSWAAVKAPGLVQHHLRGQSLTNVLRAGASQPCGLFSGVALVLAVNVDLEDVNRPGDDAHATVALLTFWPTFVRQDDVTPQAPVAPAPRRDGVKKDRYRVVRNLPRSHRLRQELSLELQWEVASCQAWKWPV